MNKTIKLLLFLLTIFLLIGCTSTNSTSTLKVDNQTYSKIVREHFDEVASAFGEELESITCLDNDCNNTVIYFNFNNKLEDLDFIIRGNAVTFSNLRNTLKGVSGVTVIATLNGNTIYKCDARGGVVTQCE